MDWLTLRLSPEKHVRFVTSGVQTGEGILIVDITIQNPSDFMVEGVLNDSTPVGFYPSEKVFDFKLNGSEKKTFSYNAYPRSVLVPGAYICPPPVVSVGGLEEKGKEVTFQVYSPYLKVMLSEVGNGEVSVIVTNEGNLPAHDVRVIDPFTGESFTFSFIGVGESIRVDIGVPWKTEVVPPVKVIYEEGTSTSSQLTLKKIPSASVLEPFLYLTFFILAFLIPAVVIMGITRRW